MLVNAPGQGVGLVWHATSLHLIPIERLQVQTVHLRLVVVFAEHTAAD